MLAFSHQLAHRDIAGAATAPSGYFGVVAMGKLGGREMNYSSDMDIIFLYEGEEGSREFFTRVAQRMITILTSPTAEGSLYEIDMRLRPSGHSGPLVTTIEAFERYHKEGSMVWERQAMTKARWVAGDEIFRGKVVSLLDEIVFGGPISGDFLDEIARVRKRMEEEIADETGGKHYDIKTGYGGLVDIEFAVQMIQLAHGRNIKSLRTQSTIVALDAAAETGLADEKQYNTLRRSYSFYREIENRSQIYQDRSDSKISLDEDKLTLLAMRMGYKERERAAVDLLDDIRTNREQVREVYDIIFRSLRNEMDQDGRDKGNQPGG
jgi:glutamate-ammonia-ligase adenylyltransferase